MQDEQSIIGKILTKYPELSEQEQQVFDDWVAKNGNQRKFNQLIDIETRKADLTRFLQIQQRKEANREKYYAAIATLTEKRNVVWFKRWQSYVAAASIILILGIAGYIWFGNKNNGVETGTPSADQVNNIKPGQFKAKLILDDGTVVVLDSAANGHLTQQGKVAIINQDGKLVYQQKGKQTKALYNTLETTKGETYAAVLSDGSKVWLNSQSSIHYPVTFSGDVRKVEIVGEAYFEVAHDANKPFIVSLNGIEVKVTGTKFNINAYSNEDVIKTTLLEGKVEVKGANSSVLLKPGEQAVAQSNSPLTIDHSPDVDAAVAWRFGYFQFRDADLKSVMRQLERWYDIEVVYESAVPKDSFSGKLPRTASLPEVLEALQRSSVHFRVEGKKIIVSR